MSGIALKWRRKVKGLSLVSCRSFSDLWMLWLLQEDKISATECVTLPVKLADNNLLLQHFQLFLFPSVFHVSRLCSGLTLLFFSHTATWTGFQTFSALLTGLTVLFSFGMFHCAFHYVNLSNTCSEQAFHSIILQTCFVIVAKGQVDWLKYFCVVRKTSHMHNRKITKPRQS